MTVEQVNISLKHRVYVIIGLAICDRGGLEGEVVYRNWNLQEIFRHTFKMKILTTKKEVRLQKKKNKMAALVEIVKLNDKERIAQTGKAKSEGNIGGEEPDKKRIKLNIVDFPKEAIETESNKSNVENSNNCNTTTENINLTEEQLLQLKKELNQRKKCLRRIPKFRLKQLGSCASLSVSEDNRTPIFLTDIQHLLMSSLLGNLSPCHPSRWCCIEKGNRVSHTFVFVVEGLSLFHFLSYESQLQESSKIFEHKLEVIMPPYKEGNIIEELSAVPLTNMQKDELIRKYGSLEAALEINKDPTIMVKTVFPVENQPLRITRHLQLGEKFPRTQLLLSALQMVDEGYPLPLRGELANKYQDYVFTKDLYTKVTANSPMFGLDCEMCKTASGFNEVTRISIVNEDLEPVYETFVRPTSRIVDYLTKYSGITPEMMLNVTKTLQEVQDEIRQLLPCDAILVGQSLNSDLHAMRMMHPYVIDTSVIFNITGERRRKTKLQTLARMFLGEAIQENTDGHDSVEDCRASMKLTQLKLSEGVDFGDAVLKGRNQANMKYNRPEDNVINNLFAHVSKAHKRSAIITSSELANDLERLFIGKTNFIRDDNPVEADGDPSVIDCYVSANGCNSIINNAIEVLNRYSLVITNISVPPQRLELSRIDNTISNIDKWTSKIWESVPHNGLFVVLFGSAPGSSSGVAMIQIKKDLTNAVSESPITA